LQDSVGGDVFGLYVSDSSGFGIYNFTDSRQDLTVDGSGNVGIGTETPSDIIDIRKNQNAQTNFYLRNTDTTNTTSRAYLNIISGNRTLQLGAINADHAYINAPAGADLYFQDGGTNNMVISGSGNVGIGTTDPGASKLTVSDGVAGYTTANVLLQIKRNATNSNDDTSRAAILLANNSNGFTLAYGGTTDRLRFINGGGTEQMTLLNGGNVGIGTDAPASLLETYKGNVTGTGSFADSHINLNNTTDVNSTSLITFGYPTGKTNASAYIGYICTSGGTAGKGDFIIGNRDSTNDVASTERMRITSAGKVGIGTDDPQGGLHIQDTAVASFPTVDSGANNLIIEHAGEAGMTFVTNATGASSAFIDFIDSGSTSFEGRILYNHANNWMTIHTARTQALKIDSSQNATFAGDVTADYITVGNNQTTTRLSVDAAGYAAFQFGGDTNGSFCYNNTTSRNMAFGVNQQDDLVISNGGDVVIRGQVTATGIKFDANGEVLDDYEEGTWTPEVVGNSTAGTWNAQGSNTGVYTKIGRTVILGFSIHGYLTGASGTYAMLNLPWTAVNSGYSTNIYYGYTSNSNASTIWEGGYVDANHDAMYLTYKSASSTTVGYHGPGSFTNSVHLIGTIVMTTTL